MKYNILARQDKARPYIIGDFIATTLSKKTFELVKENNPDLFKDYVFIAYKDTDFSWWASVSKKLFATKSGYKLKKGVYFDCDWYGNVREI